MRILIFLFFFMFGTLSIAMETIAMEKKSDTLQDIEIEPITTLEDAQRSFEIGRQYMVQKESDKAIPFFQKIYTYALEQGAFLPKNRKSKITYIGADAALALGLWHLTKSTKDDAQKALMYLHEAYTYGNSQAKIRAAYFLGKTYVGNPNIEHDYEKAQKYTLESRQDPDYRDYAALSLGIIAFRGWATPDKGIVIKKDYKKAKEYFEEAIRLSKDPAILSRAEYNLFSLKHGIIHALENDFDRLRKKPSKRLIKEVQDSLTLAQDINPNILRGIRLASSIKDQEILQDLKDALEEEISLDKKIKEQINELERIKTELQQEKIKEQKPQHRTKETDVVAAEEKKEEPSPEAKVEELLLNAHNALTQNKLDEVQNTLKKIAVIIKQTPQLQHEFNNINEAYVLRKAQSLLEAFTEASKSYSKKPSYDRLRIVQELVNELEDLRVNDIVLQQKIRDARKQLKGEMSHTAALPTQTPSIEEEEKKEIEAREKYLIIDPFNTLDTVPVEYTQRVHDALIQLKKDYLNVRAKKLESFTDMWRIRADSYRIIYTLLPQQQTIGIIAIGPRTHIYEEVEKIGTDREAFFISLNTYTAQEVFKEAQTLLKAGKSSDTSKAAALFELFCWIHPEHDKKYFQSLLYEAAAYSKIQVLDKAERALQALVKEPSVEHELLQEAHFGLARIEQKRGRKTLAEQEFEKAIHTARSAQEVAQLRQRWESVQVQSPQPESPSRLREKFLQAQSLFDISQEQGVKVLEEFLQEADNKKELNAEIRQARKLLKEHLHTQIQQELDLEIIQRVDTALAQNQRDSAQEILDGVKEAQPENLALIERIQKRLNG